MNEIIENRRNFIRRISLGALALPFLANCQWDTLAQKTDNAGILDLIKKNADVGQNWTGAIGVPADVTWKTVLAAEADKGERMIISGTVYQADGTTPAPNTLIYLYHTDIYGHYGNRDKGEPRHGRYRGWMLTDPAGRYEFSSIKPASYPDSTISAHVHMTVTTRNMREDSVDSILSEGDRFLTARERSDAGKKGGFNPILKMEKGGDGIMRGVRNIQLWS
jgi:protocatechuate 3,4-dioxygenase beta subunit